MGNLAEAIELINEVEEALGCLPDTISIIPASRWRLALVDRDGRSILSGPSMFAIETACRQLVSGWRHLQQVARRGTCPVGWLRRKGMDLPDTAEWAGESLVGLDLPDVAWAYRHAHLTR